MKQNNGYLKRPFALIGLTFFVTVWLMAKFGYENCIFLLPFIFSIILLIVLLRFKERAAVLVVIGFTVVSACLCFYVQDKEYRNTSRLASNESYIVGTLLEIPTNGSKVCVIDAESINSVYVDAKVRLSVFNLEDKGFDYYDKIAVKARISPLEKFNKSTIDSYKSKGIYLTGYCSIDDIKITENDDKPFMYHVKKIKASLCERILSALPNENGGLIIALVLGDESFISEETEENFRIAGVSHLTAVSGMHTFFWSVLMYSVLSVFLSSRKSSVITVVFLLFFMMLTGFTPSVVRSGLMMMLFYFGNLFRKKSDSLNSIGFAALLIAFINPYAVCGVGTLLSFSAALGLIFSKDYLNSIINRVNIDSQIVRKIVVSLLNILLTSVVATVSTLPIIVFSIGDLSLLCLVGNLISVNISMYIMVTGGIAAMLLLFPITKFIGNPFIFVSGYLSKILLRALEFLSKHDSLYVSIGDSYIKVFTIAFIAVMLFVLIFKPQFIKSRCFVVLTAVNMFVFCLLGNAVMKSVSLGVTCSDVDEGICVLLTKGDSSVLICEDLDKYTVRNTESALKSNSVRELDIVYADDGSKALLDKYCNDETVFANQNSIYEWQEYLIEFSSCNVSSLCRITGNDKDILIVFFGQVTEENRYDIVVLGKDSSEFVSVEAETCIVSSEENLSVSAVADEYVYTSGEENINRNLFSYR